jgi:hypothetical protein
MEDEAGKRLGIEVGALGRHALTAECDREDVVDARLSQQKRHVSLVAIDQTHRIRDARRVRDPLESVPVDEFRVELTLVAADELDTSAPVRDHSCPLIRLVVKHGLRLLEVATLLPLAWPGQIGSSHEDTVRREDVEPRVVLPHDERHDPRLLAALERELDRTFIPMMTVGDEEASKLLVDGRGAPEPRAVDLHLRLVRRSLDAD